MTKAVYIAQKYYIFLKMRSTFLYVWNYSTKRVGAPEKDNLQIIPD